MEALQLHFLVGRVHTVLQYFFLRMLSNLKLRSLESKESYIILRTIRQELILQAELLNPWISEVLEFDHEI